MEGSLPQNGRNIYFIAPNNTWGNFIVLRTLFCHLGKVGTVFKWKKTGYIFYCVMKSYKLSGLENASLFVCSSAGQKSEHGVTGFSAQGLRRWNQSVSWAEFPPGPQGPLSRPHGCWKNAVICGRITGPWLRPDYWLGFSLSFEAAHKLCHMTFSIFKGSTGKSLIPILSDSQKGDVPFKDLPN